MYSNRIEPCSPGPNGRIQTQPRLNRRNVSSNKAVTTEVQQISNTNSAVWVRILWLVVCLGATGALIYQATERITHYIRDPSITNTYYRSNKSITFPTVVLCPLTGMPTYPLVRDEVWHLLRTGNLTVFHLWNDSKDLIEIRQPILFEPPRQAWQQKNVEFNISEIYTPFGICHVITPGQNVEFHGSETSMKFAFTERPSGITMHELEDVQLDKYFLPTYMRPTFYDNFKVQITQVIRRNTELRPCRGNKYVAKCLTSCFKQHAIDTSPVQLCRFPFMTDFDGIPFCTLRTAHDVRRTHNVLQTIVESLTRSFSQDRCNCAPKCKETVYNLKYSIQHYDPVNGFKLMALELLENGIQVTQEEIAYTGFALFCDLGGTLGFWLGLCVLQLLELATGYLSRLAFKTNERFRKKQPTVASQNAAVAESTISVAGNEPTIDLPGFRNVNKKDLSIRMRVFWLLVSLPAAGCGLYQCAERISHFMSDPSTVNIYYDSKHTIDLPSVTICPAYHQNSIPAMNPYYMQNIIGKVISFTEVMPLLDNGTISIDDLWNISRFNYKSTLSELVQHRFGMNSHMFEVRTILGTCLTFQSDERNLSFYSWISHKITLFGKNLNLHHFKIILHDAEDLPLIKYLANFVGYKCMAFSYENAGIRLTEVTYRNVLRNPCKGRGEVIRCVVDCIEKAIFSRAAETCRLPYTHSLNKPPCSAKQFMALRNATLLVTSNFTMEDCNCPRTCKQLMSTVDRRTILGRRVGEHSFIRPLITELGIDDNRVLMIREEASYDFMALFCDLGGALGLLSGFCIMQMIDTVLFYMHKIVLVLKKQIRKNPTLAKCVRTRSKQTVGTKRKEAADADVDISGFNLIRKKTANWRQMLRLTIWLAVFFFCGYQCYDRIVYYQSDPTEVNTYYVHNTTIDFPLVAICPNLIFEKQVLLLSEALTRNATSYSLRDMWTLSDFKSTWNETSCDTNEEDAATLVYEIYTFEGICRVFQVEDPATYLGKLTSVAGLIPATEDELIYTLINPFLFPDDISLVPYAATLSGKTFIGHISVSLTATTMLYRNTRNSPCTDGETVAQCVVDCIEEQIYNNTITRCRLPYMQENPLIPECTQFSQYVNISLALIETMGEGLNLLIRDVCSCPRKCKVILYSIENLDITPALGVREGGILFEVHIPDNRIYIIQEEGSYNMFKLLADLGNTLGLYFGLGVLQMVEMLWSFLSDVKTLLFRKISFAKVLTIEN